MSEHSTPFGKIRRVDGCKDDYKRIGVYDQPPVGGAPVVLQGPALKSFREAENRYGNKRHWRPGRPKAQLRKDGTRFRPIFLTGSIRSCELQKRLYESDPNRFAHPSQTLHTHGLAIDVHTGYLNGTIKMILRNVGWNQSRPVDEPWHFSFFLTA
jgi:hypothetical protein